MTRQTFVLEAASAVAANANFHTEVALTEEISIREDKQMFKIDGKFSRFYTRICCARGYDCESIMACSQLRNWAMTTAYPKRKPF